MKRLALLALILMFVTTTPACDEATNPVADGSPADILWPDMGDRDLASDAVTSDTTMPAPTITSVQDKGNDGVTVVGEHVQLSGANFGGGCTTTLGGKTALVISQSQQDLTLQTPEGIPVGTNAGVLTCPNGAASFSLSVTRYHLVTIPDRDRIAVLQEATPGDIKKRTKEVTFSDPDVIVLSSDSAVAYVATERNLTKKPKIGIVDIVASGGPALQTQGVTVKQVITLPIFGLATAADAPVLAVANGLQVIFYDTTDPRAPVSKGTIQFVTVTPGGPVPQITTGFFIDVAFSPDGKTAVILDGAADHIHVYDISNLAKPKLTSSKIKISGGASTKPVLDIPVISGLLGALKVQGGSAMKVVFAPTGDQVAALAGGGLGALIPETFNLSLDNTTVSIFDVQTNAYVAKLESLKKAHFPNNLAYVPKGELYVSTLSSATALLTKVIFQIAVMAALGGGSIDLSSIGSLLFKSYKDLISIIEAAWKGKLFDLGGIYSLSSGKVKAFWHIPYIQGGMCATYDSKVLLSAGQGWTVKLEFGFPQIVKKFEFKYDLGVTIHDLTKGQASYKYLSLYSWKAAMLLPPWFFGDAACQQ